MLGANRSDILDGGRWSCLQRCAPSRSPDCVRRCSAFITDYRLAAETNRALAPQAPVSQLANALDYIQRNAVRLGRGLTASNVRRATLSVSVALKGRRWRVA